MTRDDELPVGEEKAGVVRGLFDTISPRYDLMNRLMTFGMDVGWRRRAIAQLRLPPSSLVFDLACGTGDFCCELSRSGHRPVGFDFAFGMLANARTAAPLVQADVLRLPVPDASGDAVTCGFALRNVVSLDALFTEAARVVRPGGTVVFLETSRPDHPVLRAGHAVYVRTLVPTIGGLLSDRAAYAYLPRSMAYLPPLDEMLRLLRDAGFPDARQMQLSGGIVQLLLGTRA